MRSRRALSLALAGSAAVSSALVAQSGAEITGTQEGRLYEQASRSVFRIEAGLGHGSGFLVDASGLIATNDHVVAGADEITLYVDSVTRIPATLVTRDPDGDLAILRVSPTVVVNRTPLPLADSPVRLAPGDRILALGFPLSQPLTLTAGMVANVRSGAILTDATVNPGNSGGPILTPQGTVVAVTTFLDRSSVGPGLGGAVLVDRLSELLSKARGSTGQAPSDRRLPIVPLTTYPISVLKSVADTLDPLLFSSLHTMTAGPFAISVSTPLSRMLAAITTGRHASKDRRKRESKAGVPEAERYAEVGEIRDWAAYVGEETAPVVAIKVEPLFGETGGSAFRRGFLTALVGFGGQATIRFQGDVRKVTLKRNGEVVEPLRGGHAPVRIAMENDLFDFNDVADFGYYVYPPETFRPLGPQRPPEIVIEIEDLKNPQNLRRERLTPALVARLWNDFEGFYRHVAPSTQFSRYALTKSCATNSGAAAMGGVGGVTQAGDPNSCEYVLAAPGPR